MLLRRVRRFVRRHGLFGPESRVLVALSGGSDSVALLAVLQDLASAGEVRLAGVAHFNHQLRSDALRDERFSAALADRHGLAFVAGAEDVRARARRERRSLEDAGRTARHEFLQRAREEAGADLVALGHTRDDQAETYLLRLVRGAGPRGLASMAPRRGTVIRPLLECRRDELRALLARRGLEFVDDESNRDVNFSRNRVRGELIPFLQARFNPRIVDVLAREAGLAGEIWAWLDAEAEASRDTGPGTVATPGGDPRTKPHRLDARRLEAAPPALRRLLVWRAMSAAAGGRPVTFEHVEAALDVLAGTRSRVDGPGQRVQRIGPALVLTGRRDGARGVPPDEVADPRVAFEYPLPVPGEVQLREAGCALAAEHGDAARLGEGPVSVGRGPLAAVRRDLCPGPLVVRSRRPGDRFRPVGLGGRKSLQDYFVDRKVARSARDRVPVVVDGADRIVWVAGYGIDEAFRVTDPSQSVLLLRLRQV